MVAVKLLENSKITVGNAFLTAKICTKSIFGQSCTLTLLEVLLMLTQTYSDGRGHPLPISHRP